MDQDQVLSTKNLKPLDQNQDQNLIIPDQNPLARSWQQLRTQV